jgi:glycosyltransferase involved in cell wall biosynthesis
MIAIVLTYYQRSRQLLNTLDSFRQYNPDDFFVVVVDDNSPDDIVFKEYPFKIIVLKITNKTWINPGPAYNMGFGEAISNGADSIIIQNAECYHRGDIIGSVKKKLKEKKYLTFGCYSLSQDQDIDFKDFDMRIANHNGDSAWYNHSKYRPEALHFCTAITVEDLKRLNGFDERFAPGIGFDDNYFIHQVRSAGLKVEFIDDPFVLHQWHYDVRSSPHVESLYLANSGLYHELAGTKNYRAQHILTPDL